MSVKAPKIDERDADQIAEQVTDLLKCYVPDDWKEFDPLTGKPKGVSSALIHVFARFLEIIIQRLNKVPEKNFMAFLDMLGVSLLPPQPARVPLTFTLSAGSTEEGRAPAGTQVAAAPAEGEKESVIFETERELVVTAVKLPSVFARNPDEDKYADLSSIVSQKNLSGISIFNGNQLIDHILYIGHNTLLNYPVMQELTVDVTFNKSINVSYKKKWYWEKWDGKEWSSIEDKANYPDSNISFKFRELTQFYKTELHSRNNRWLRCRLSTPVTEDIKTLQINNINLTANVNREGLSIDKAFTNILEVDLSKEFFPFGEKPGTGDTFYFANSEAFSKPGVTITLKLVLDKPVSSKGKPQFKWELGNGNKWTELKEVSDDTNNFTRNGKITFTLPKETIEQTTVNGVENYWLRVRIMSGNYGHDAGYNTIDSLQFLFNLSPIHQDTLDKGKISPALNTEYNQKKGVDLFTVVIKKEGTNWLLIDINNKVYDVKKEGSLINVYIQVAGYHPVPATFEPPLISTDTVVSYSLKKKEPPDTILTYNDFFYKEVFSDFKPFTPTDDENPTLYLGFIPPLKKKFPNSKINLYFSVAPVIFGDSPDKPSPATSPRLIWEYWNNNWSKLTIRDETEAFTRPGLVEFMAPSDFSSHKEFEDLDQHWLRVRLSSGEYEFKPKLNRLLLNTTMASQSITIRDEILGSSDGSENQKFKTRRAPVLSDQIFEVHEPEPPSASEQAAIKKEQGKDAVFITDKNGRKKTWVRWHETPDFYGSGPRDRHYVLNHLTGDILFGDGINGLIPPVGNGNLRMHSYKSGGGACGNKAENTIIQLKTTVPYIEKVTNTEAASGGADAESLESLINRAPRTIRHRSRAVTLEDYEDMAMLASPKVARAKCVPLHNLKTDSLGKTKSPGETSVIIVPHSNKKKPLPSLELINRVKNYLEANAISTANISVAGPLYVNVNVTVEIALISMEGASAVEQAVHQKLADFLHPLTGGSQGTGWAFGRKPYKSDFYALIEAVQGVDHIRFLSVTETEDQAGVINTDRFLVYSGEHIVTLYF